MEVEGHIVPVAVINVKVSVRKICAFDGREGSKDSRIGIQENKLVSVVRREAVNQIDVQLSGQRGRAVNVEQVELCFRGKAANVELEDAHGRLHVVASDMEHPSGVGLVSGREGARHGKLAGYGPAIAGQCAAGEVDLASLSDK